MKTKICIICNKIFKPIIKHFGIQKCCSKKCRKVLKRLNEKIYSSTPKFRAMRRKYMRKYSKTEERKIWEKKYSNKPKTKLRRRNIFLLKHYGISLEYYNKMVKKQQGLCAICYKKAKRDLDVDHNHKTGKIRGLLCRECNVGLGYLKDNLKTAIRLVKYLRRLNEKTTFSKSKTTDYGIGIKR